MRSVWCRRIVLLLSLCAALSYVVMESTFNSCRTINHPSKTYFWGSLNSTVEQTVTAAQIKTTRPDSTEVKGVDQIQSDSFQTKGRLDVPTEFLLSLVSARTVAIAKFTFVFIEYHLFVNKYEKVISNLQTMR